MIKNKAHVNLQEKRGRSPLLSAAENGHLDCCDLLIKNKAHVNLQEKGGRSPLYIAAENGYLDCCDLLIKNKADVNLQNKKGWSPHSVPFGRIGRSVKVWNIFISLISNF